MESKANKDVVSRCLWVLVVGLFPSFITGACSRCESRRTCLIKSGKKVFFTGTLPRIPKDVTAHGQFLLEFVAGFLDFFFQLKIGLTNSMSRF